MGKKTIKNTNITDKRQKYATTRQKLQTEDAMGAEKRHGIQRKEITWLNAVEKMLHATTATEWDTRKNSAHQN